MSEEPGSHPRQGSRRDEIEEERLDRNQKLPDKSIRDR
jgi:hypothetical protein